VGHSSRIARAKLPDVTWSTCGTRRSSARSVIAIANTPSLNASILAVWRWAAVGRAALFTVQRAPYVLRRTPPLQLGGDQAQPRVVFGSGAEVTVAPVPLARYEVTTQPVDCPCDYVGRETLPHRGRGTYGRIEVLLRPGPQCREHAIAAVLGNEQRAHPCV